MYNADTLKTELIGLVGWRQNADPSGVQLTTITSSSSGLYFNDIHPVLTFDNLLSIAPRFDLIDSDPAAVNAAFTNWLQQKTEAGIVKAISSWANRKIENRTAVNLLADARLFRTTGHVQETDADQSQLVGIEITPERHKGVASKIRQFSLQLTQNQSLTVNLFHSASMAAVGTPVVASYTASGGVQWFTATDWTMEPEGTYYIVYDQRDLTGLSVNGLRDYNYDNRGLAIFPGTKFFQSVSFSNPGTDAALWDISKNSYTLSTNYGLNVELDVRCDYTDLIVDQKALFANLVALQVAMDIIRELAFNPGARVNRNEAVMSTPQLLYEIDGDAQGRNDFSLLGKFNRELSAVAFDDTGISKHCLPCRRRSARIRSIGTR